MSALPLGSVRARAAVCDDGRRRRCGRSSSLGRSGGARRSAPTRAAARAWARARGLEPRLIRRQGRRDVAGRGAEESRMSASLHARSLRESGHGRSPALRARRLDRDADASCAAVAHAVARASVRTCQSRLLQVRGTRQAVPDPTRRVRQGGRRGARGRRDRLRARGRRDARRGRRIGLRQDHRWALHPCPPARAHRGHGARAGRGRAGDARRAAARVPPPRADDLPGSLRQPEPAHDHPPDPRGTPWWSMGWLARARPRCALRRCWRARRPRPRSARRLPPPVLGRPAPAHRHRARRSPSSYAP